MTATRTGPHPDAIPDPLAREESPLTKAQARRLTDKVIKAGEQWFDLLLQTWTLKAWAALKYRTWEDYARGELGMSVRNAYRVLDQARVVQALEAAGVEAQASARQASVLREDPTGAASEVAAHVTNGTAPAEAVAKVVAAHKPQPSKPVPPGRSAGPARDRGRRAEGTHPRAPSTSPTPVPAVPRVIDAKSTAVKRPKSTSRTPHPAEAAGYSLMGVDPDELVAVLSREAAQRLAGELEGWLVAFKGALTRTGARAKDKPKCDKHPVGSRIGTACGACGDTKAWPAK